MNKYVALTFDDGPSADCTVEIIELLRKHSVKASFFVCGRSIDETTAPILRRAYDMGCEINNHSNSHTAFTELTEEQMREEISITSAKVEQITGEKPRFFRPPFISVDERVMKTVEMPFICGICSQDWDDGCSAQKRYDDIMAQVHDGAIILMHDMAGNSRTVEAVSRLIPALLDEGYEFVTVSELFRAKNTDPYKNRYIYSTVPQKTVEYSNKASDLKNGASDGKMISVCGDDCGRCPRYNAKNRDELTRLAKLWFRLGWRDCVVEPDEMKCTGCGSRPGCSYGLRECCKEHGTQRCTDCMEFPCGKIDALLEKSEKNRQKCLAVCSDEEYCELAAAFYEKEKNLGLIPERSQED